MHPDHIIKNILMRMQEEKRVKGVTDSLMPEESVIGKIATVLQKAPKSYFSKDWIQCHQQQFQSHLERIADYLVDGPGKWWIEKEDGVEFQDQGSHSTICSDHFHSTNMAAISLKLHTCWEQCLLEKVKLPSKYIKSYNGMGEATAMDISEQEDCPTTHPTPLTSATSPTSILIPASVCPTTQPAHLTSATSPSTSILIPASVCPTTQPAHPTSATSLSTSTIVTPKSKDRSLFTNLGRNLMKILPGQHELIHEIDTLRHKIKTSHHVSEHTIRLNKEKCKLMKTIVLEILDKIETHKNYMIAKSVFAEFHNL